MVPEPPVTYAAKCCCALSVETFHCCGFVADTHHEPGLAALPELHQTCFIDSCCLKVNAAPPEQVFSLHGDATVGHFTCCHVTAKCL